MSDQTYWPPSCNYCKESTGGCTGECVRRHHDHLRERGYYTPTAVQKGCICPPGSEQTCLRSDCGRKNYQVKIT